LIPHGRDRYRRSFGGVNDSALENDELINSGIKASIRTRCLKNLPGWSVLSKKHFGMDGFKV
jgi:hypothetical protein